MASYLLHGNDSYSPRRTRGGWLGRNVWSKTLRIAGALSLIAVMALTVDGRPAAATEPEPAAPASLASVGAPGSIALGVYRPAFPNDLASFATYEGAIGDRLPIVHWFAYWGGWKRDFSRTDLERVAARGSIPMISWEPWAGQSADPAWSLQAAILSGANDDYIDAWARGLSDYGRPVILRFAHEMHHQTYPWAVGINGNTAEDYVAAWYHVRAIFDRYPTANVEWVWNPNTLGDAPAHVYEPIYRSLYPGDDLVDWVGLDIYNTGPAIDWGAPYWRPFNQIVRAPYDALGAITDKPVILPEVGSAESGGSKAAWITEALAGDLPAEFPRIRAVVWFDIVKEERWAIESSPEARAAWIAAARQSHFRLAGVDQSGDRLDQVAFLPIVNRASFHIE